MNDPSQNTAEAAADNAPAPCSGPSSAAWLGRYWLPLASHLLVLGIWWLGSFNMPRFILPSPLDTVQALFDPRYNWPRHTLVTASEVFSGFTLASVVGVSLAVLFNWWPTVSRAAMPLLVTLNMIPKVAMAPLFIVWLSYGVGPNILITFSICFFPIVINSARGLREVETELIDLVRVLHASRTTILVKIQLPSTLPFIFSGMRVAAVLAVAGAIVGEFIGSERGLGYVMMGLQSTLDTPGMFAALVLITLIGVTLYGLVAFAERCFLTIDAKVSQ